MNIRFRISLILNAVLGVAVLALIITVVVQQKTLRPVTKYGNTEFSIVSTTDVDAVEKYSNQLYFRNSYEQAQKKRSSGYFWNHVVIKDAETAIMLADIYLKNEYIGSAEFSANRWLERDAQHGLWVVTYELKDWPHMQAFIIIDDTDGTELFCAMPQGM